MPRKYEKIFRDPKLLNLVCSTVVLLFGLTTYWARPPIFRDHVVLQQAFEFWLLKWLFFVVTWGLFNANTDLRFVLAANDLNSILGLGFVIALWQGDPYNERQTVINLVLLFGLLFAWNFVTYTLTLSEKMWIFPSMTVSLICIFTAGITVWMRFRSAAGTVFLIMSGVYLLLQLPSYQIIFAKVDRDPDLIRLLALAKLAYGGLFYAVFFQHVEGIEKSVALRIPVLHMANITNPNPLAVAVLGGVLTQFVQSVGKGIWKRLKIWHRVAEQKPA
jgi:hypothetical protein